MSEWTYEYENEGNGHFAEWWNILYDGDVVARMFESEERAEEVCTKLNAYQEMTRLLEKYIQPEGVHCRECGWRLDGGHMKECVYGNLLKLIAGYR